MSNLSNLQQRVITGLIGAAVFIGGLVVNEYTFLIIMFLGVNLCLIEFFNMVKKAATPQKIIGFAIANTVLFLSYGITKELIDSKYLTILIPLVSLVFFAELYRKKDNPFSNIGFTILGVCYVAIPFSLVHFVAFVDTEYYWQIVLGYFLLLWTSDSMAYFTGKYLGRTKLFERISPKKTWEGSAGALVFSVGMAFLLSNYFTMLSRIDWIVIAVITVVFGGMADLVESLLKRSFDIKDSGTMLPGHGGFLDRFDGLLLSMPLIATYLILFA